MLNLTSKKTFEVIEYILDRSIFSQTQIHRDLGISIGHVNKIIHWLIIRNYVEKSGNKYRLIKPHTLVRMLALTTFLVKRTEYNVALSSKNANSILKEGTGILCLNSALQGKKKSIEQAELNCYHNEDLIRKLNALPRGKFKITTYEPELDYGIYEKTGATSNVRTIIDFSILGLNKEAEELSIKKWRTHQ